MISRYSILLFSAQEKYNLNNEIIKDQIQLHIACWIYVLNKQRVSYLNLKVYCNGNLQCIQKNSVQELSSFRASYLIKC